MFEDLKKNIEQEKKIVADMHSIEISMQNDSSNRNFYVSSFNSLLYQLKLLNKAVPELLKEWSSFSDAVKNGGAKTEGAKKAVPAKVVAKPEVVRMSYVSPATKEKRFVTINKADKKEFLQKLKMSEGSLVGLQKIAKSKGAEKVHGPNPYVRFSNKFFRKYSDKVSSKFDSLSSDLKKANLRFLLSSYISVAMMSAVLSVFLGILIYGALVVVSSSLWVHLWIPVVLPALVLMGFYFYPASEASSVQKKISQELPFVTIHMAAIAGSNIEPTKIFKIIAASREYPNVGNEIRKIIAQVDIYGYDLVTSLKNVATRTSNKRLSELFSGLATNIATGGELKNYLKKKAENFLLDYKLERQKYSDLAGTFMDVYISILIAAPLVLMMMLIVMNVANMSIGFSLNALLMMSIGGIIVANIVFLVVLNMKQPKV